MFLTDRDLVELVAFRHDLHRHPEISGEERQTAARVQAHLAALKPDRIITGLGGHGVAAVFSGTTPGPTLLFRCELDALPIPEISDAPHRSDIPGKGHLCGHDGHMAIMAALARGLARRRPVRGRVVLMFQPAEETGAGAAAVLADPAFTDIRPDLSFSLHNLPGLPLGHVALASGPVNCASRGLRVILDGKTAHASMPETGISPMHAVSRLMPQLTDLARGNFPSADFAMVTLTHAVLGEPAFGIAPGRAEVWATLRTLTDAGMADLCARAEALISETAAQERLALSFRYEDIFHHCENAPEAVAHLSQALAEEDISHDEAGLPMRASEDFGRFAVCGPSAMLFLGSGEAHPALHNPDYDFPDVLIEQGARIFLRVIDNVLELS
ncbi:amidohydrolase [Rhizobium sp. PP-F2F-G38]|uniref:amidohydrolase n=1 Tax=Rhizobium sp. PP-CC-3G-465 TaxID=2135648 RepID=UPI000D94DF5F|nr:amidohydrolase [Rhizobium sp. PP-WC-1G-195]PYE95480.1 amidohydrolase [Rhizobium sp. PP-F2F-G38]TCQ18742.1 amidohydrolase [Rhizobium sp. PP-CC-3G-465]